MQDKHQKGLDVFPIIFVFVTLDCTSYTWKGFLKIIESLFFGGLAEITAVCVKKNIQKMSTKVVKESYARVRKWTIPVPENKWFLRNSPCSTLYEFHSFMQDWCQRKLRICRFITSFVSYANWRLGIPAVHVKDFPAR